MHEKKSFSLLGEYTFFHVFRTFPTKISRIDHNFWGNLCLFFSTFHQFLFVLGTHFLIRKKHGVPSINKRTVHLSAQVIFLDLGDCFFTGFLEDHPETCK